MSVRLIIGKTDYRSLKQTFPPLKVCDVLCLLLELFSVYPSNKMHRSDVFLSVCGCRTGGGGALLLLPILSSYSGDKKAERWTQCGPGTRLISDTGQTGLGSRVAKEKRGAKQRDTHSSTWRTENSFNTGDTVSVM